MSTGFTVGEVAHLEELLIKTGTAIELAGREAFLSQCNQWFERRAEVIATGFPSDLFLRLLRRAQLPDGSCAAMIALGALSFAQENSVAHPIRARFAARFGMNRIVSIEGARGRWSGVGISAREESEARDLFELARGDRSFEDDELSSLANAFVSVHRAKGGITGDLASDLEQLLAVLLNDPPPRQATARAALTYFALASDAIPDDLGLIGLLDDICVVRWALEELWPERAPLGDRLDLAIGNWPFLRDIEFVAEGHRRPISEFATLNASMLLIASKDGNAAAGIAVVAPERECAVVQIGLLAALASVYQQVDGTEIVEFQLGERLTNRQSNVDVIFQGYRRLNDARRECRREEADAFAIEFNAGGKHGGRCREYLPLATISNFHRSPKTDQALKPGRIALNDEDIQLGPLERLFGSPIPLGHPTKRKTVIVVTPLGFVREVLNSYSLFGSPLMNVLPTGRLHVSDGVAEYEPWNTEGSGGEPYLAFVRTIGEARDIAEEHPGSIVAVVASLRHDSPDATNLATIARAEVPVLGLIGPTDTETIDVLDAAGFKFWSWSEHWLRALRWPIIEHVGSSDPLSASEEQVRVAADARIATQSIEWRELERFHASLECLPADENARLSLIVRSGYMLLLRATRQLTSLDARGRSECDSYVRAINGATLSGQFFWSEEVREQLTRLVEASEALVASLGTETPKSFSILQWLDNCPDSVIGASRSTVGALRAVFGGTKIFSLDELNRRSLRVPVLIPAWYSRAPMSQLLFPPRNAETHLLLYGPEHDWFRAGEARYHQGMQYASSKVAKRSAISYSRSSVAMPPPPTDPTPVRLREPDDYIMSTAHTEAVERLRAEEGERAEAILVGFRGGHWAAFLPDHQLHSVTHLVGLGAKERESADLRPIRARDLRVDDAVILLRGSDSDAIRDAVDRKRPGLREFSSEWRRALQRFIAQGHSLDELTRRLAERGCKRRMETIRWWVNDDAVIRPQRGGQDIDAILVVTDDSELRWRLAKCKKAVDEVWKLHHQVGRELARKVLAHIEEWLAAGIEPHELVEVEERVVLATVDFIDGERIDAPRNMINRLQEP